MTVYWLSDQELKKHILITPGSTTQCNQHLWSKRTICLTLYVRLHLDRTSSGWLCFLYPQGGTACEITALFLVFFLVSGTPITSQLKMQYFQSYTERQTGLGPRLRHFQIPAFLRKKETVDYESQGTYKCPTPDHLPVFKNRFKLLLLFISVNKWYSSSSEQSRWKNMAKYIISIDWITSLWKLYYRSFSSLLLWN